MSGTPTLADLLEYIAHCKDALALALTVETAGDFERAAVADFGRAMAKAIVALEDVQRAAARTEQAAWRLTAGEPIPLTPEDATEVADLHEGLHD